MLLIDSLEVVVVWGRVLGCFGKTFGRYGCCLCLGQYGIECFLDLPNVLVLGWVERLLVHSFCIHACLYYGLISLLVGEISNYST